MEYSLFEVNEDGDVVLMGAESTDSVSDGDSADTISSGDTLSVEAEDKAQEDLSSDDTSGVPVVLSDEVTAALLSLDAAEGSLSSSTLDYFDRVVSGLPDDYIYVAYRTSSNESYSGVLYYGEHVLINGNTLTFKDGVALEVVRTSSSYSSSYITYTSSDASGTSLSLSQSGSVLYYSNAFEGYPVLGGVVHELGMSPYIMAGLVAGMISVVLGILFRKR